MLIGWYRLSPIVPLGYSIFDLPAIVKD